MAEGGAPGDALPPDDDDADRLVARAVESVLQAVPDIPGGDVIAVETAPNVQPWAETAAPAGRNKKALEEFIADLEARVAEHPGSRARTPDEPHPADAYLASLAPGGTPGAKRSGKRRWRGRGRRRGGGKGTRGQSG